MSRQNTEFNTSDFIIEAMQQLNSSLELVVVLENTLRFLKKHFPVEAISLHKFLPEKRGMLPLFFVNEDGCQEQEAFFSMTYKEVQAIQSAEKDLEPILFSMEKDKLKEEPMVGFVKNNFLKHLKNKNPNMLIIHLATQEEVVVHFALFALEGEKFTEHHKHLLTLLRGSLTSAMINIHHYNELEKSRQLLIKENIDLKRLRHEENTIIGNSLAMRKVTDMVHTLVQKDVQILILGETGTGKEVVADAIMRNSLRASNPFIKVNCGAIPETLIDSELFGYEKGAFTGAFDTKKGFFEQANTGTLFLDEVGELSLQAQVRLLRVLQFGLVERVGGKQSIPVDVRIIAATNRNLENMLQLGTFREDLYYRLHTFPISLPSLRARKDDIPLLVRHFMQKLAQKLNIAIPEIDTDCILTLQKYSWPGNVRELENLVERSMILSAGGKINLAEHLPKDPLWYLENVESLENNQNSSLKKLIHTCILELQEEQGIISDSTPKLRTGNHALSTAKENHENITTKSLDELMHLQITEALKQSKGKVSGKNGAAEILNINCNTLRKRMQKLGITCKKNWE